MKSAIFILIGSLAVGGAYQSGVWNEENSQPDQPTPVAVETAQPVVGIPVLESPLEVQQPADEILNDPVEVSEPVQPIEERGDTILSEIDMLGGLPFDQAVTMPFD